MQFQVLTIFPELLTGFLGASLVGKAIERELLEVDVHDLRDFTHDRHRSVDDEPYGGGGGMIMTAPPLLDAVRRLSAEPAGPSHRVLLSPQGRPLDESKVRQLATHDRVLLICGRYEGIDERVQSVIDEEISVGDFVLSGGELPAMVLIEAVSRQIPGVVGLADSVVNDSFRNGLLDHPHYTRPRTVEGQEAPAVLLSGDHRAVANYRRRESLRATLLKRPDLLERADLTDSDRVVLDELAREEDVDLEGLLEATRS